MCRRVITDVNNTRNEGLKKKRREKKGGWEGEREGGKTTHVGPGRILQELHKAAFGQPVVSASCHPLCVPLIKMTKHFLSSCTGTSKREGGGEEGGLAPLFPCLRKLNNPLGTQELDNQVIYPIIEKHEYIIGFINV